MKKIDIVIIGGGSAGLAAAVSAYENGCRDILVLERDKELGGILLQCIHNGFGLHVFGEELAGPSYAERWINWIENLGIAYKTNSMVTHLGADKTVEYVNQAEGYVQIQAKAVILAMGCRERTRGAITLPGYRPSGIWTAGTAQRYLNMEGYMVGRKIFLLGSGDIGLIMARRMTLEGGKVLGVAELMPYSNGLPRNLKQCLEDFDIPLFLSHTIVDIKGKERITSVVIAEVDQFHNPVPDTEKEFEADTLLLSVGLIPENTLSEEADIKLHPLTRGAAVDEYYQTSVEGIFACGNVLHVHDLVDFVSQEGEEAGKYACDYVNDELHKGDTIQMVTFDGFAYILPQEIRKDGRQDKITLKFRVTREFRNVIISIAKDMVPMKDIPKAHMIPAEMVTVTLSRAELEGAKEYLSFAILEDRKQPQKKRGLT